MSTPLINATPATQNSNLPASSGSPFSPGIPLEAHQPIFGREEAFRFAGGELARYRSVNIIGERRMGKTSLLKHLLGNQQRHITPAPNQPPLVLAHLDIQENISNAEQFYGKALRELLDYLPSRTSAEIKQLTRDEEDLRETIRALLRREIIEPAANGYRIIVPLIAHYVRHQRQPI